MSRKIQWDYIDLVAAQFVNFQLSIFWKVLLEQQTCTYFLQVLAQDHVLHILASTILTVKDHGTSLICRCRQTECSPSLIPSAYLSDEVYGVLCLLYL